MPGIVHLFEMLELIVAACKHGQDAFDQFLLVVNLFSKESHEVTVLDRIFSWCLDGIEIDK
jgi:hypothetical protein